jgi:ketosteroid isomerase-like protein
MGDLGTRLDLLESESALTRLVYDYCHGIDQHDLGRFLGIWSDDATWDTGGPFGSYTGIAEIEKGLTEAMWPAFQACHHWTVNPVFDIAGDEAQGLSNLTFQGVSADGTALVVAATYRDRFARRTDRWYLTQRVIEIHHFVPVPGVSFTPLGG